MIVNCGHRDASLLQSIDDAGELVRCKHEIAHHRRSIPIGLKSNPTTKSESGEHLHVADCDLQVPARKSKAHDATRLDETATPERLLHCTPVARRLLRGQASGENDQRYRRRARDVLNHRHWLSRILPHALDLLSGVRARDRAP